MGGHGHNRRPQKDDDFFFSCECESVHEIFKKRKNEIENLRVIVVFVLFLFSVTVLTSLISHEMTNLWFFPLFFASFNKKSILILDAMAMSMCILCNSK